MLCISVRVSSAIARFFSHFSQAVGRRLATPIIVTAVRCIGFRNRTSNGLGASALGEGYPGSAILGVTGNSMGCACNRGWTCNGTIGSGIEFADSAADLLKVCCNEQSSTLGSLDSACLHFSSCNTGVLNGLFGRFGFRRGEALGGKLSASVACRRLFVLFRLYRLAFAGCNV